MLIPSKNLINIIENHSKFDYKFLYPLVSERKGRFLGGVNKTRLTSAFACIDKNLNKRGYVNEKGELIEIITPVHMSDKYVPVIEFEGYVLMVDTTPMIPNTSLFKQGFKVVSSSGNELLSGHQLETVTFFKGGYAIVREVSDGEKSISKFIHLPTGTKINDVQLKGVNYLGTDGEFIITENIKDNDGGRGLSKSKILKIDSKTGKITSVIEKIDEYDIMMPTEYENYGESPYCFLRKEESGKLYSKNIISALYNAKTSEIITNGSINFIEQVTFRSPIVPYTGSEFTKITGVTKRLSGPNGAKIKGHKLLYNSSGKCVLDFNDAESNKEELLVSNEDVNSFKGNFGLLVSNFGKLRLISSEGNKKDITGIIFKDTVPPKSTISLELDLVKTEIIFTNSKIIIISSDKTDDYVPNLHVFDNDMNYLGDLNGSLDGLLKDSNSRYSEIYVNQKNNDLLIGSNEDGGFLFKNIAEGFKEIKDLGNSIIEIDSKQFFNKNSKAINIQSSPDLYSDVKNSNITTSETIENSSLPIDGLSEKEIISRGVKYNKKLLFK